MSDANRPVGLPTGLKERLFVVTDRIARRPTGQRWLTKAIEVSLTSLGAGNHDYSGDRTGENRLISAIAWVIPQFSALDVGANQGAWTLEVLARSPGSRVVAVEPGSQAGRVLQERLGSEGSAIVVPVAVGNREGSARLYGTAREGDLASLMPDLLRRTTFEGADPEASSEDVTIWTLEHLVEFAHASGLFPEQRIDVVKVDTEGFELEIIRQVVTHSSFTTVQMVQFEFNMHAIAQGQMIDDFIAVMGNDFEYFRLAPRALVPRGSMGANLANYFGFSNWVALRREIAPRVRAAYLTADPRMRRPPEWRS